MATDLYKLYQSAWGRAKRNAWDDTCQRVYEIASDIVKRRPPATEMLRMAKRMVAVEGAYSTLGHRFVEAIESGDFEVNIPYPVRNRWDEKASSRGALYVATAPSRPAQCKLGATKDIVDDRLKKYSSRHGYHVELFWCVDVDRPLWREAEIAEALRPKLVTVDTKTRQSVEWYRMSPASLRTSIQRHLRAVPVEVA